MAPIQRRNTNLSLQGTVAVIILVIMFVTGIFCTVVFMKICSTQRRRERAMRSMQEQNAQYVGVQYTAPPGAPSNGTVPPSYLGQGHVPTELHGDQYKHNGPQELQGEGRPEFAQPQQIDGYMAAVSAALDGNIALGQGKLICYSQRSTIAILSNYPQTLW